MVHLTPTKSQMTSHPFGNVFEAMVEKGQDQME